MNTNYISVPASQLSSLRCGGDLRRVFAPMCKKDLSDYVPTGEPTEILGGLTNTLVLSGGVEKVVFLSDGLRGITVRDDVITAYSGEKLANIARVAKECELSGLENLSGICGTIGGAVRGNAGAFGSETAELVAGVEVFKTDTAEFEYLTGEEIAFGYRYSNLREGKDFIVRADLRLFPSTAVSIAARTDEVRRLRADKQVALPSLGSVFKRVGEVSAGWYIERAGLKGYRYGGMEISSKHANFIVNFGGTPEDYLYLVRLAELKVYETFGIKLQREVKIIGEPRYL